MKASEFVKVNGLNKCRKILDDLTEQGHSGKFYQDLKRLIVSKFLVSEHGTIERAKEYANSPYTAPEVKERLLQAIADVESCND